MDTRAQRKCKWWHNNYWPWIHYDIDKMTKGSGIYQELARRKPPGCQSPTSMTIGLYRDVWIAAIASSTTSLATRTAAICVRFQGRRVRRVYVTMQITFLTRKSALIYRRGLRQRVASLTLNCNGDFGIRAYVGTSLASPS